MITSLPNTPKDSKNNTSRSSEHYSNVSNGNCESLHIRSNIFKLLDENPLLTPKQLAKQADLPYKEYRNYLTKLRSDWKYYHAKERGSKCSNLHCFKGKLSLEKSLSVGCRATVEGMLSKICVGCSAANCVGCSGYLGWTPSKARNKFLVWHGGLGRVTWFTTGTLLLHVRKPGNLGRAKQLFCDAFGSTGLVTDVKLLIAITDGLVERVGLRGLGLYQKEVHAPYVTNQRLPPMEIRDFEESHGIIIKVGDRSHPNAIEVIAQFPAQTERLIEQTGQIVRKLEAKELENVELKTSLSRLMSALDKAIGEVPSNPQKENLKVVGAPPSYVS
jgi:hypothetical protein